MAKAKSAEFVEQIAADLAEGMGETAADPSKALLSSQAQKERIKGEWVQSLTTHFDRVSNGIDFLLDRMEQLADAKHPHVDRKIYDDIIHKMANKQIDEGLTTEELKACFAAAIDVYNHQEYNQAADVFYVLTVLDPTRPLFWKCLGSAKFFDKQFKEAFDAYAMALKLNERDPECLLYQAHCLQSEGRTGEAIDLLQQAVDLISKDSQFAAWNEKVTKLIQELKNKQ